MTCIITIFYLLAAHLPIYYFYNLRVFLAINSIHLCVVCGSVSPSFFFLLPESDLGCSLFSLLFFFPFPVFPMEDCSCGCLAKMARIAMAVCTNLVWSSLRISAVANFRVCYTSTMGFTHPMFVARRLGTWRNHGYVFLFLLFSSFCRSHFESHGLNL